MSHQLTDVFSVVATFCYPATLWALRLSCSAFRDAVNAATETLVIPVCYGSTTLPEVFAGLYFFRLNAVLLIKRIPARTRIRTGKAVTREFAAEDAHEMAREIVSAWLSFPCAVVDADPVEDAEQMKKLRCKAGRVRTRFNDEAWGSLPWFGEDPFGMPVKLLFSKRQRAHPAAPSAELGPMCLLGETAASIPFVVVSDASYGFALNAAIEECVKLPMHELPNLLGNEAFRSEPRPQYKDGTLTMQRDPTNKSWFAVNGNWDAESKYFAITLQRAAHRHIHHIFDAPPLMPFRNRAPPGMESAASARAVAGNFVVVDLRDAAQRVGQPPWLDTSRPPPEQRTGSAAGSSRGYASSSLEWALLQRAPAGAPRIPTFAVPRISATSTGRREMAAILTSRRLASTLLVLTGGMQASPCGNWNWVAHQLKGGCAGAVDISPSSMDQVILKVGVDEQGRDVLVPTGRFMSYLERIQDKPIQRGVYVADNRFLGTFYAPDLYNPTPHHEAVIRPQFDRAAMDKVSQDGQPLDTPWILWGGVGMHTSEHMEPHGSSVWVHCFQGRKQWFVLLPRGYADRCAELADCCPSKLSTALPTALAAAPDSDDSQWFMFLQEEGETVLMPPGVRHVVVNVLAGEGTSAGAFAVAINYMVKRTE